MADAQYACSTTIEIQCPAGPSLVNQFNQLIYKAVLASDAARSTGLEASGPRARVTKSVDGETLLVSRPGHGRVFT
jgi:hypothetical protein